MWQVLLAAAAAAGSGILAKKLISPIEAEKPIPDLEQNNQECSQNMSLDPQDSIFHLDDELEETTSEEKRETIIHNDKIFRFSSCGKGSKGSKGPLRKSTWNELRGLKKNGGLKKGKKKGSVGGAGEELMADQRVHGSRRRVFVSLKKRRTGKHAAGQCESCASKDMSFGWGVGLGIMHMMSAGKAEISKLHSAVDDTAKIVQELKAEIFQRKSLQDMHDSVVENEAETNIKGTGRSRQGLKSTYNGKSLGPALTGGGECSSSVLTEEQQPDIFEMDQLGAELESELQKLPWCVTRSDSGRKTDILEAVGLEKEFQAEDLENSSSYQHSGLLPAELDRKLSQVLIQQQESQIVELETELHQAHSKLHAKEAELQALTDCVKRLTQFSLGSASDEETEEHEEDIRTRDGGIDEMLESDSTRSIVGTKRTLGYDSYTCSTK